MRVESLRFLVRATPQVERETGSVAMEKITEDMQEKIPVEGPANRKDVPVSEQLEISNNDEYDAVEDAQANLQDHVEDAEEVPASGDPVAMASGKLIPALKQARNAVKNYQQRANGEIGSYTPYESPPTIIEWQGACLDILAENAWYLALNVRLATDLHPDARAAGTIHYIAKPVSVDDAVGKISTIIRAFGVRADYPSPKMLECADFNQLFRIFQELQSLTADFAKQQSNYSDDLFKADAYLEEKQADPVIKREVIQPNPAKASSKTRAEPQETAQRSSPPVVQRQRSYSTGGSTQGWQQSPVTVVTGDVLEGVPDFMGERGRPDLAHKFLKKFCHRASQLNWNNQQACLNFEMKMNENADLWFKQLPKGVKRSFGELKNAFLQCYGSGQDTPTDRYYNAEQRDHEHILDYLLRLNGYASDAKKNYRVPGPDAVEHVRRFLKSCKDPMVKQVFYPLAIKSIDRLEESIQEMLYGTENQPKEFNRRPYRRDGGLRDGYPRTGEQQQKTRFNVASLQYADEYDDEPEGWREYRREAPMRVRWSDQHRQSYRRPPVSYEEELPLWIDDESEFRASPSRPREIRQVAAAADAEYQGRRAEQDNRRAENTRHEGENGYGRGGSSGYRSRERGYQQRPYEDWSTLICAACGRVGHPTNRCFLRCKTCLQVHPVGQCEVAKQLRSVVQILKEKTGEAPAEAIELLASLN